MQRIEEAGKSEEDFYKGGWSGVMGRGQAMLPNTYHRESATAVHQDANGGENPTPRSLHHCQKVLKSLSVTDQNSDSNQQVAIVKKEGTDGQTYTAALFGIRGMELVHSTITRTLPQFPGSALAIADTTETSDDILDDKVCWIDMLIHHSNRIAFLIEAYLGGVSGCPRVS